MRQNHLVEFFKIESASGIILFLAAFAALFFSNSPFVNFYQAIFNAPVVIQMGPFHLTRSFLFWINEGLMSVFFLLVGVELKQGFLNGELGNISKIGLSAIAAAGGMLIPALIYVLMNFHQPEALAGWAIPVATDIAFALGVLSLFGKKVPAGLKLFLMALAIFDDIGAIIIIAVFYNHSLAYGFLLWVIFLIVVLWFLNQKGLENLLVYLILGVVLWGCVFKSGIHPTVAGVLLALMIPDKKTSLISPLKRLESMLHPWVAFLILPLFALANAGLIFEDVGSAELLSFITLGISLGLFLGKQIGVFGLVWLTKRLKLADLPEKTTWLELYGVAVLCGIGFTMSLFLGTLAFQDNHMVEVRLGVLLGSLLSGCVGAMILHIAFLRKMKRG